ncbi:MAG: helix-turn-helix domain-containing protein [Clostridiales bacterium]|nr:helix-turn-helix domain-containing protein [Clostridiales bacterium]
MMTSELTDPVLMGQRIKEQRLLHGYSREKLAEMTNITPRYCYDIELGTKNMSLQTLCKVASALSVSTDYILFGPKSADDAYLPLTALVQTCPPQQLEHLEQIVSQYLQAVQELERK